MSPPTGRRRFLRTTMRLGTTTVTWLVCLAILGPSRASAAKETPSATTSQQVHPLLIRNERNEVLRLVVDGNGENELTLRAVHFRLEGTDDIGDIESLELLAGGETDDPSTGHPFGKASAVAGTVVFRGERPLDRGPNVFRLSCRLKPTADLAHRVGAICTSVETTAGTIRPRDLSPGARHRIGIALRKHQDDGVHTYRIPSLATTSRGTLLCVYDMRRRMGRDLQEDIDIGLSRSTDGGRSWEPVRVIMDMGLYSGLPQEQNGCSDPGILVDHQTGEVFVFA